jgi:hypothetical protein
MCVLCAEKHFHLIVEIPIESISCIVGNDFIEVITSFYTMDLAPVFFQQTLIAEKRCIFMIQNTARINI